MKKRIFLTIAIVLAIVVNLIPYGESKTKSYYAGDAVNFRGQLIIGTTNTGSLEIFQLTDNKLNLLNKFKPVNERFGNYDSFYDMAFYNDGNRLYVYATDGRNLYKYDASDLSNFVLIKKVKDNSWDWFSRISVDNGKLITFGTKGVKIWSSNMEVVDTFKVVNKTNPHNIIMSSNYKFIFNVNDSTLEIFDQESRDVIKKIGLTYDLKNGNRRVYNDSNENAIYAFDDSALKKFNFSGDIVKSFKNDSGFGYDVVPSTVTESVYLSSGSSVIKLNKSDFKVLNKFSVSSLKEAGSWAMGLKLVDNDKYVVVFDNTNIVVLDNNLKKIASVNASEEENKKIENTEKLSLGLDKVRATSGSTVSLRGVGYTKHEKVTIDFMGNKNEISVDDNGAFQIFLTVPNKPAGERGDIKVTGQDSGLNYSIAFEIE